MVNYKMINKLMEDYVRETSKNKEEAEVILYGLKILGTSILTLLIIVLLGVLIRQVSSALIYLSILLFVKS